MEDKCVHSPKFILEKVSNMIFLVTENDVVFKSWDVSEFTERKLQNAIKKIQSNYLNDLILIRKF